VYGGFRVDLDNEYSERILVDIFRVHDKIYRQFIKGVNEKLYSKYVYIPIDEELKSILKLYEMYPY
jgi:hypothetical protein